MSKFVRLRFPAPLAPAYRHFSTSKSHGKRSLKSGEGPITPVTLLPHAVALTSASALPRPIEASAATALLDELYSQPASLAARVPRLQARFVRKMRRSHNVMMRLTEDFGAQALSRIYPPGGRPVSKKSLKLSPLEHFRFCRAFYRVELFYTLFRGELFTDDACRRFLQRHPPWENEQLGCVDGYLKAGLDQAFTWYKSGPVDAEDQECIDSGVLRTAWLSQGVGFIAKVITTPSRRGTLNVLRTGISASARGGGNASLLEALHDAYSMDDMNLFEEKCDSFEPHLHWPPNADDADPGPSEAWRAANSGWKVSDSVMADDNAWLRDRAYVMWDSDRLRKMGGFKKEDQGDVE